MIQILNNLSNEHVILDGLETHLMTKGLNMLTMKNNLKKGFWPASKKGNASVERDSINIPVQNAQRVSQRKNRYSTGNKKTTTMLSTGKCFNSRKLRHKKG